MLDLICIIFRILLKIISKFILTCSLIFLVACTSLESMDPNIGSVPFSIYQSKTIKEIKANRVFQSSDTAMELQWNAPQEWKPVSIEQGEKPKKGILFVHGLGDSPWSFHDIAKQLANDGYLVRTVLLPGHGTTPFELLDVTAEDWQRVVYEQALSLQNDVSGDVFLGGFSTGANLVLDYAYQHPNIAGLILFSPGFKSMPFDWLAPIASRVMPWVITPKEDTTMQTPLRYMNVPTNGYAQYYRTSVRARKLLKKKYNKPVFLAVAEHDSVLDTKYLLNTFVNYFTHPSSRLIWYGELPKEQKDSARILVRSDKLPQDKISQFSHMGLLFSPDNPLYGKNGSERICLNSMSDELTIACEKSSDLWFSAWGYEEKGKIHARLTFNPYFNWQLDTLLGVIHN